MVDGQHSTAKFILNAQPDPQFYILTIITIGQRILTKGHIAGGGQCNVTPTTREHCSRLQQSRYHVVIEDRMIPCAAYTAAETPNAFP